MNLKRPILITGFGSVGRRHLRNLQSLGYKNLILLRTGKSSLDLGEIKDIRVEFDLKKALLEKPIAVIITNPTAFHIKTALAAIKAGAHIFLEKPISHNLEGVASLKQIAAEKNLLVQVGYQFRFHPHLIKIKQLLDRELIGEIVSVQAHWGEYLPDFHPWEDYRQSYSARADLGGGVLLTLSHAFDYLNWLFGKAEGVSAVIGDGGLGTDVEESAEVLLSFTSGIKGYVHLDFVQSPAEHYLSIIGQKGVIYLDFALGLLKWNYRPNNKWQSANLPKGIDRNQLFILEMKHFLSCIEGKQKPVCTLEDGIKSLQIALAAKDSFKKGRLVKL